MPNKWICALSIDQEVWEGEQYDTKQEAINAGLEAAKRFNADPESEWVSDEFGDNPDKEDLIYSFAVGEAVKYELPLDVDVILEMIQEQAWDDNGEFADGYLDDVTEDHKEELEDLIFDWFKKHNYLPGFYTIENVERINVL